jgi:hypothetical protein
MKTGITITLSGAAGFSGIAGYLHVIQAGYSPVHQLMSELASGRQGSLMLFAFLSLATSIAGAVRILSKLKAPVGTLLLLSFAGFSMAAAGIFTLSTAPTLHVVLIASSFILLCLVMYLVPRHIFALQKHKGICWGLCFGIAFSTALGGNILPIGIAQRLASGCLLVWLCWLAIFTSKYDNNGT